MVLFIIALAMDLFLGLTDRITTLFNEFLRCKIALFKRKGKINARKNDDGCIKYMKKGGFITWPGTFMYIREDVYVYT